VIAGIFFSTSNTTSQVDRSNFYNDNNFIPGEIIAVLKSDADASSFVRGFDDIGLSVKEQMIPGMNIYLFSFDESKTTDIDALMKLMRSDKVSIAQFNHYIHERVVPNDASFGTQWDKNNTGQSGGTPDADIDAPEAWDISKGGVTISGDTIVVAIVDGGQQISHTDLDTWRNWGEIAGNSIDDDNNGYVDDVNGWNAGSNNGTIPANTHGTHCAGIAGAKGNNNLGVAGVNWKVKTMPVVYGSATESNAIKAYGYVYKLRKKYNETNGAQGAFVVSTNSSWGIDYGNPANYPLWCAFYDSLGTVGVLSAGAGPNLNINIDTQGDIPTTCPSKYLIAVTNTTRTDARNSGAGYGAINMDLGAPGTSILSTVPTNTYSTLTGTSMATPQVAGAVGLIYAGATSVFSNLIKNDPDSAASLFKQFILASVDTIPALTGITVSNGRLNIYKMLQKVNINPPKLNVTFGIEAMWNGTTQVNDTLRINLRQSIAPYSVVDSAKVFLNSSGNAVGDFLNTVSGNYYVQTKHRSALECWSNNSMSFSQNNITTFDFTTWAAQTYGSNSVLTSGRYCAYSGDIQNDGIIDLTDVVGAFNDADAFVTGYVNTDIDGDNLVDLTDILFAFNNSNLFISAIMP